MVWPTSSVFCFMDVVVHMFINPDCHYHNNAIKLRVLTICCVVFEVVDKKCADIELVQSSKEILDELSDMEFS